MKKILGYIRSRSAAVAAACPEIQSIKESIEWIVKATR